MRSFSIDLKYASTGFCAAILARRSRPRIDRGSTEPSPKRLSATSFRVCSAGRKISAANRNSATADAKTAMETKKVRSPVFENGFMTRSCQKSKLTIRYMMKSPNRAQLPQMTKAGVIRGLLQTLP